MRQRETKRETKRERVDRQTDRQTDWGPYYQNISSLVPLCVGEMKASRKCLLFLRCCRDRLDIFTWGLVVKLVNVAPDVHRKYVNVVLNVHRK